MLIAKPIVLICTIHADIENSARMQAMLADISVEDCAHSMRHNGYQLKCLMGVNVVRAHARCACEGGRSDH